MSLFSQLDHVRWASQKDGFGQTEPMSWREFFDAFFSDKHELSDYIYRGVAKKSYELESTLNRECKKIGKELTIPIWQQHLSNFRYAIRGRIKLSDTELATDEEIWAIGQHHGLATPLLDWTESPFVAAFFAFHQKSEPHEDYRAIYALNTKAINIVYDFAVSNTLKNTSGGVYNEIREQSQTVFDMGSSEHKEIRQRIERIARGQFPAESETAGICRQAIETCLAAVRIVRPMSGENARLVNQRGLFTYFFNTKPLDVISKSIYREAISNDLSIDQDEVILAKFIVCNNDRQKALKHLAQMNINYSSLFPDLYGASKNCNSLFSELPAYG